MLLNVIAASRRRVSFDADALAYIAAVEFADNAALEPVVKTAINNFVVGCKADGNWEPIKASCLLAGARTLDGALVPLRGSAPTKFSFASGDYSRTTGLKGDGSTKYLDSNRNNNADPQNSKHIAVWIHSIPNAGIQAFIGTGGLAGGSHLRITATSTTIRCNSNTLLTFSGSLVSAPSLLGVSRGASNSIDTRFNGASSSSSIDSATPQNASIEIFRRSVEPTSARIAFYSIGESVDLAKLDTALTAYMAAIAAAGL
jgi:hypothetical protein